MENNEPQPAPSEQVAGTPAIGQQIKLPSFWPEAPTSWFRLAEGQFILRNIGEPMARYYHFLAVLSVYTVCL